MTHPDAASGLGMVVGGSLTHGVEVRLDPSASVEEVKVGTFVTLQGRQRRFFGVVTDVALASTDPRLRASPPDVDDPFIAQVISGTAAYGTLQVTPMLTLGGDAASTLEGPQPAKTIPPHFARVSLATQADVQRIFGQEDARHFYIGNPLDMEAKVCLDLEELVKRSNGVFGKSGTGKTFLARLLLIGILQKTKAVNLVFDMHSEYGWMGKSEGGYQVKGLRQLFPSQVAVFSLDAESSRRRGLSPDSLVQIGLGDIDPEDIQVLSNALNLSEVAAQSAYVLERHLGRGKWVQTFLSSTTEEIKELASQHNLNESALGALHRRLVNLQRFPFLVEKPLEDSVQRILEYLDRGTHVVLEFGRFDSDLLAYILVSNLLTRRIRERYVQRTEQAAGDKTLEPRPLVITIEEAHKFLTPGVAAQTTFGTIAREMRKYNVTLLIVDQRPGDIDEEVLSQLGTKLSCLLDNQRDMDAVLSGAPARNELRTILSRLESKQQALLFGHALPMPVVVRVRDYGTPQSYADLGAPTVERARIATEKEIEELWGKG